MPSADSTCISTGIDGVLDYIYSSEQTATTTLTTTPTTTPISTDAPTPTTTTTTTTANVAKPEPKPREIEPFSGLAITSRALAHTEVQTLIKRQRHFLSVSGLIASFPQGKRKAGFSDSWVTIGESLSTAWCLARVVAPQAHCRIPVLSYGYRCTAACLSTAAFGFLVEWLGGHRVLRGMAWGFCLICLPLLLPCHRAIVLSCTGSPSRRCQSQDAHKTNHG